LAAKAKAERVAKRAVANTTNAYRLACSYKACRATRASNANAKGKSKEQPEKHGATISHKDANSQARRLAEIHTYIHKYRHVYWQTDIQTARHPARQPATQSASQPASHTYIHTSIHTDRQADIQTGRQAEKKYIQSYRHANKTTHRQTGRPAGIHTYIQTYSHTYKQMQSTITAPKAETVKLIDAEMQRARHNITYRQTYRQRDRQT